MKPACVIICGVRPQYVKAAALRFELDLWERRTGEQLDRIVIDTGQHRMPSLATDLQAELSLDVTVRLHHDVGNHDGICDSTIRQLTSLFRSIPGRPSVVVFGDATPAYAGAMAANACGLRLVHIEAGERRDPRERENVNSRAVDRLATLGLCVSRSAVRALHAEGFRGHIVRTGDLAYRWFKAQALQVNVEARTNPNAVITMHRPQHMQPKLLRSIATAVADRAPTQWVLHPRSAKLVALAVAGLPVTLLPPQGFAAFVRLVKTASFVVSDSGGVIREAHLLGKPIVAIRDGGGWMELDDHGSAQHIKSDLDGLNSAITWAMTGASTLPVDSPIVDIQGVDDGIASLIAHCR
jgi:UDP-N-acetylglucosamine 2-epimerase